MAGKLEVLQKALNLANNSIFIDSSSNDDIRKLKKWYSEIISKYKGLQITKMKSLDLK